MYNALPEAEQALLHRVAGRIRTFAEAQRASITDVSVKVPGGTAGHTVSPCRTAGCYAPGGRYPLPSSVLMTAVTARVAGVTQVVVASPRPVPITIGAAFVAGADYLLAVGGAQAIAALAYGVGRVPACDVIVGPGNRWVTAAKSLVAGHCAIDMLAGPSECLVLADETADARLIAADLLAQAEHDTDALPILVTTHEALVPAVEAELTKQLAVLPTRETAAVSTAKVRPVATSALALLTDITFFSQPAPALSNCCSSSSVSALCRRLPTWPLSRPAGLRRGVRQHGRGDRSVRHRGPRAPGGAGGRCGRGLEAHQQLRRHVHRRQQRGGVWGLRRGAQPCAAHQRHGALHGWPLRLHLPGACVCVMWRAVWWCDASRLESLRLRPDPPLVHSMRRHHGNRRRRSDSCHLAFPASC